VIGGDRARAARDRPHADRAEQRARLRVREIELGAVRRERAGGEEAGGLVGQPDNQ
jgi:hypothetical protein